MHLAFVIPPNHGHVNPSLPLVAELIRRGHDITFATGASLVDKAERIGATPVPLPMEEPVDLFRQADFSAQGFAEVLRHWFEGTRADMPVLVEHFEKDRPDAVCYDFSAVTGRILAERLRVPGITLSPTFAAHENFSYMDRLLPADFDAQASELLHFGARIQELAVEYGFTGSGPVQGVPEALNLVFLPREFQFAGDTFDERFRFIGPSLAAAKPTDLLPEDADRVLFVTLGTSFNKRLDFFRDCAQAFAGTDWHLVMALGPGADIDDLGPLPRNVKADTYVAQSDILRRATVVVSLAGTTTTMDALACGVPMVALPGSPGHRLNAERIEELGLGCLLAQDQLTPEAVRAAVERVADDPEIATRVAWMRERIANCGGAAQGADAIEAHLAAL